MASPLKRLISDDSRYLKSFQQFLESATEHQCVQDFIDNLLPDVLASTINGESHLNVIGVGSGSGEVDLKMLSTLHLKSPQLTVENEVVEPNLVELHDYRDLVSQTPGLDYIKFNWNNMTAEEFEEHWKEKKMTKKVDFIHMLQVLYYVKDLEDTISFYQSLLTKNGKLLISLVSGKSGWVRLWQNNSFQACTKNSLTTEDIKSLLDSKGLSYQSYELPAQIDITECFTEGDEKGELLLDFITHVLHFSKSALPEVKAGIMECLRHPDCSVESNGKVMFKHNMEMIVIDKRS